VRGYALVVVAALYLAIEDAFDLSVFRDRKGVVHDLTDLADAWLVDREVAVGEDHLGQDHAYADYIEGSGRSGDVVSSEKRVLNN
jgi:hypothetical protein